MRMGFVHFTISLCDYPCREFNLIPPAYSNDTSHASLWLTDLDYASTWLLFSSFISIICAQEYQGWISFNFERGLVEASDFCYSNMGDNHLVQALTQLLFCIKWWLQLGMMGLVSQYGF